MKTREFALTATIAILLFSACSSDNKVEQVAPPSNESGNPQNQNPNPQYPNGNSQGHNFIYYSNQWNCSGQRVALNRDQLCRNLQIDFQNSFNNINQRQSYFNQNCSGRDWNQQRTLNEMYASNDDLIACSVSKSNINLDNYYRRVDRHLNNNTNSGDCLSTNTSSQILIDNTMVMSVKHNHRYNGQRYNKLLVEIRKINDGSGTVVKFRQYTPDGQHIIGTNRNKLLRGPFKTISPKYDDVNVSCYQIPKRQRWYNHFIPMTTYNQQQQNFNINVNYSVWVGNNWNWQTNRMRITRPIRQPQLPRNRRHNRPRIHY